MLSKCLVSIWRLKLSHTLAKDEVECIEKTSQYLQTINSSSETHSNLLNSLSHAIKNLYTFFVFSSSFSQTVNGFFEADSLSVFESGDWLFERNHCYASGYVEPELKLIFNEFVNDVQ